MPLGATPVEVSCPTGVPHAERLLDTLGVPWGELGRDVILREPGHIDGLIRRRRALDSMFVEHLRRSLKYEDIYPRDYATVLDLEAGLQRYFAFYNHERPHQSLNYAVPGKVYQGLVPLVCQAGTLTHSTPFVVHNMGVTLDNALTSVNSHIF